MPGGGEMPETKQTPKNKACLICIDGWGISPEEDHKGDAIYNAETPVMDKLEKEHSFTSIAAHGLAVGLPDGLMGNSEVGHLNIGAGRVVYQVRKEIETRWSVTFNVFYNRILFVLTLP